MVAYVAISIYAEGLHSHVVRHEFLMILDALTLVSIFCLCSDYCSFDSLIIDISAGFHLGDAVAHHG